MERIRSFIAVELPDELKRKLDQLETELKRDEPSWVKWVSPDSIHLTLKFLGNIASDTIAATIRVMEKSALGITPFQLRAKDLGVFPNPKRVQVVWVGINGEVGKLTELQKRLDSNLAPLGFTPESRPFTPHLTLARLNNRATLEERQRLGKLIASTKFEDGNIEVATISLMQSQLTRAGAIHSRIGLVKLKKE